MKNVAIVAGLLALMLWPATNAMTPDPATPYTEGRVLLLDKNGNAADLTDITATAVLTLKDGQKRTIRLDVVKPLVEKGKAAHLICGEVTSLEYYYVEFVINGPTEKPMGREGGMKPRDVAGMAMMEKSFLHDHGGPYFKADLTNVFEKDKPVNFTAEVSLFRKNETWITSFQYPIGLCKSIVNMSEKYLGTTKELANSNQWDKIRDIAASTKATIETYPPLTFKAYSEDADRFARAREECVNSCRAIEAAVADKNKARLDEAVGTCVDNLHTFSAFARYCEGAAWK